MGAVSGDQVLPLPGGVQGGLEVLGLSGSSGIELKADPGVPLVYLGFGFLMLTTALSLGDFSEARTRIHEGGRHASVVPMDSSDAYVPAKRFAHF